MDALRLSFPITHHIHSSSTFLPYPTVLPVMSNAGHVYTQIIPPICRFRIQKLKTVTERQLTDYLIEQSNVATERQLTVYLTEQSDLATDRQLTDYLIEQSDVATERQLTDYLTEQSDVAMERQLTDYTAQLLLGEAIGHIKTLPLKYALNLIFKTVPNSMKA